MQVLAPNNNVNSQRASDNLPERVSFLRPRFEISPRAFRLAESERLSAVKSILRRD